MPEFDSVTGFQRDLLCVLSGLDDPTGMAIQEEIAEYYATDVSHARVYQNLDALTERGLVEKGERDARSNYYRLTDRGRDVLAAKLSWKREYVDDVEADA